MLRNAFEDGFLLDISPVHPINAMLLDGLGGVLPKGECRSRTLIEKEVVRSIAARHPLAFDLASQGDGILQVQFQHRLTTDIARQGACCAMFDLVRAGQAKPHQSGNVILVVVSKSGDFAHRKIDG